jgi:hypothetical protein
MPLSSLRHRLGFMFAPGLFKILSLVLSLPLWGCDPPPQENSKTSAIITRNGLTRDGLFANSVTGAGGASAAFTGHALDGQTFSSGNVETTSKFLSYAVACALPGNESVTISINGSPAVYSGAIGLAPEWQSGACDSNCQQWITACLLAKTNYYGIEVTISLRGPSPALDPGLIERVQFSLEEGAFFGNLFLDSPQLYACMGKLFDSATIGDQLAYLQHRICASEDLSTCPIHVLGPCAQFVSPPWTLSGDHDCAGQQGLLGGGYLGCESALATPDFPPSATPYPQAVTTHLDPTTPVTQAWWLVGVL